MAPSRLSTLTVARTPFSFELKDSVGLRLTAVLTDQKFVLLPRSFCCGAVLHPAKDGRSIVCKLCMTSFTPPQSFSDSANTACLAVVHLGSPLSDFSDAYDVFEPALLELLSLYFPPLICHSHLWIYEAFLKAAAATLAAETVQQDAFTTARLDEHAPGDLSYAKLEELRTAAWITALPRVRKLLLRDFAQEFVRKDHDSNDLGASLQNWEQA